ncbi:sugar phosphate isomerase/epimerase family protein [Paenibacillus mendelii]|uniref:Sugar phosphate isomerase/epimerase family protein n=1 Tax=Paenibacillus mendelii TaxID=206163 RepID=A0ABV6JGJ3_9BACL|nr:sugar phosphate isomerase/epimerase family protein [Paenibacillus mendelii]MCQ6563531.1 sugar phosphate isomerase/epimerase [Paenibacillus mendelii]
MIKGVNQWCFPEGTSLETVFSVSQAAGLKAVELNVNPDGGVGLTRLTTAEQAKDIVDQAAGYGLQLRSLSTILLWDYPLSSQDEAIRQEGIAVVRKQVELAEAMGIDTVLVVPGVVNEDTTYQQCYDTSSRSIRELVPYAASKGVCLAIENVWNKFLYSPIEMAAFIDQFQSPFVQSYFDVGNVLAVGYPDQWIQVLGHRIRRVHVKDYNPQVGTLDGFVPLLSGKVNWKKVREALKDIGYTDTVTAELTPYDHNPLQLIHDTSQHLERILFESVYD